MFRVDLGKALLFPTLSASVLYYKLNMYIKNWRYIKLMRIKDIRPYGDKHMYQRVPEIATCVIEHLGCSIMPILLCYPSVVQAKTEIKWEVYHY